MYKWRISPHPPILVIERVILPRARPRFQGPLPLNPKKAPWGRDFPEPDEGLRYTYS